MCMRDDDLEVGVLAVDPSSPFSGGAILGDRVRMQRHSTDPGVFIRSMASRGHLGGLAVATPQAVRVLDAVGKPWVIVETVGVGQVEVEIASQADTTIVVVNPGWGDEVQAAKAGLLEIADIFVVNKADRPGADVTVSDLAGMLELGSRTGVAAADRAHDRDDRRRARRAVGRDRRAPRVSRVERRGDRAPARRLVDEIRALLAERLLERAGAMSQGGERSTRSSTRSRRAPAIRTPRSTRSSASDVARIRSAQRLHDAAHGVFPPVDGVVEVVPSPGPPCDAIVAFTGHFVLAADIDPRRGRGAHAARRLLGSVLARVAACGWRTSSVSNPRRTTRCS